MHNVNIHGLNQQAHRIAYLKVMVVLHQKFIIAAEHCHFVMHTFEDG
ncbi:hypothetical protein SDC9_212708 [bioreactor metagenome]|uniref:Uncharacterized protein n=1 Tax=bioreactor metagenome TaxID=1076179 RepID=A0A645JQC2_9ZZZZ